MSGPNLNFEDKDKQRNPLKLSPESILLILVLSFLVLDKFYLKNVVSGNKILVLNVQGSEDRALERGLCESAISSFKTNECIWGVMDEDTCYELKNADELVNTPVRFKVLHTKIIGNKCKVFARDQIADVGKVIRAFSVDLEKDEKRFPWIYQVTKIQEIFITEKEKKEFGI